MHCKQSKLVKKLTCYRTFLYFRWFLHFENMALQLLLLLTNCSERYSDVSRFHYPVGLVPFLIFFFRIYSGFWITVVHFRLLPIGKTRECRRLSKTAPLILSKPQPRSCLSGQHQLYEIANLMWEQEGNEKGNFKWPE